MAAGMDGTGGRGNRLRMAVWVLAAGLFLLPLVAMQFTAKVKWDGFDFLVWGLMLAAACGGYELLSRMSPNRHYRLGAGAAVVGAFLVFWVNAAVGMVGDGPNAYNLLFLGAIVLGGLLALGSWFRPAGMVRAMLAAAALHAVTALAALFMSTDLVGGALSLCFALPYLVSAGFFRMAARETAAA